MRKPVDVALIAGVLASVPEIARGSANGPAPRKSSEHPAPTLGSELSLEETHSAPLHTLPAWHAPVGGSFARSEIFTLSALDTSTTEQPTPITPQSAALATPANAYVPLARSPMPGGVASFAANASRAADPEG